MTAPTVTQIRTAIQTVMETVDGVGIVHAREPYVRELDALRARYQDADGKLRGWHIRRVSTTRTGESLGLWIITHRWRITGYLGFEDAEESELGFDDLIEALAEAFRLDETLGGVVSTTVIDERDAVAGLQLDSHQPVMFCGVLAHQAVCTLYTRHMI